MKAASQTGLFDLEAVLRGEPRAVRAFVHGFAPVLLRVIRRTLPWARDRQWEEDLLQELFLRLFRDNCRALRAWDPRLGRSLRAFLCVFACQRVIDQARAERRRAPELLVDDEGILRAMDAAALQAWDASPREELLLRLLQRCGEQELRLFQLSFLLGMTTAEVATELKMTTAAVYQRRHRLRRRLARLRREIGQPSAQPPGEAAKIRLRLRSS